MEGTVDHSQVFEESSHRIGLWVVDLYPTTLVISTIYFGIQIEALKLHFNARPLTL